MSDNDNAVKIYANQYVNKDGSKRYWGKFGGFEVTIFQGNPHPTKGTPQLNVYVKAVEDEPRPPRNNAPPHEDDDIPF